MTFLPSEAKEPKSKSNYTMPLAEGAHKLRVLGSAVVGYEGWNKPNAEGKRIPIRYKVGGEPPFGPDDKEPKYFWAFLVWNYDQERVQIMSVTQKTIRTALQAYVDNEAWGDPKTYDLVITRTGKDLNDTEYAVVANPHSEAPKIDTPKIDLEVWFKGEDPFAKDTPEVPVSAKEAGF